MPGSLTATASSTAGTSSSSALTTVKFRPPNLAGAKVYGMRSAEPIRLGSATIQKSWSVENAVVAELDGHDAPQRPEGEAEVLGENREDQVAPGDLPSARLPETGVVGPPLADPALHGRSSCDFGGVDPEI